ncbi:MAG: methyltransferase domain-containing protein [Pirellulales bacterium]
MQRLSCTLCENPSQAYAADERRAYYRCSACGLVFADPSDRYDSAAELNHYRKHENDPSDVRYRRFLEQLARPLLARLTIGMRGLDFGCGAGPALSWMLREAGMEMELFDPYFAPNYDLLSRQYDFVTCSEAAEHFYEPREEWDRLSRLLRRGAGSA